MAPGDPAADRRTCSRSLWTLPSEIADCDLLAFVLHARAKAGPENNTAMLPNGR